MTFEEFLEQAFRSPEPLEELRSLALRLFAQGYEWAAILEMFENARRRLRAAKREAEEDLVIDIMDFLVGWCSSHMKLAAGEPGDGSCGEPGSGIRASGTP